MNENEHIEFDLINRYLKGSLSDDEKINFERRLNEDKSLRDEVTRLSDEIALVEEFGLREQLRSIHQETIQESVGSKRLSLTYISGIAASVAILISVWFLLRPTPYSADELFNSNFKPYPNLLSIRDSNADSAKWMIGMQHYSAGNYSQALELFSNQEYPDHLELDIKFYSCMCSMALGEYTAAIDGLNAISEISIKYQQQINWYLGLCYLGINNKENALEWLSEIERDQYAFKEASKLIEQLEK